MLRGEKRELMRSLLDLCCSYKDEFRMVDTLIEQYELFYIIQERARMEFRKRLKTSEVLDGIGKIFGVSTQTLYRARSAVRASKNQGVPKKYAIKTYRNIKYNLRKR